MWIFSHYKSNRVTNVHNHDIIVHFAEFTKLPLPLFGYIWDVMFIWRKRNINQILSVLQYCVLL